MAGFGYSYVTEKGFISFLRDLSQGAWKEVVIKKWDAPDHTPTTSLLEAPRPVVWKLRATWGIRALSEVLGGASAEVLAGLDAEWDSVQRKLHFQLGAAGEDSDSATREAALRLRSVLLAGNGTAQTGYSYDDEVDFGWQQLELAGKGALADDAKKLGLAPILKQVESTTSALATGLGRSAGQKRAAARSIRLREALAACTSAFNAIHDDIVWHAEHTPAGDTRKYLDELREPFEALLSRFPPAATAKAEGQAEKPGEADAAPAAPKPT